MSRKLKDIRFELENYLKEIEISIEKCKKLDSTIHHKNNDDLLPKFKTILGIPFAEHDNNIIAINQTIDHSNFFVIIESNHKIYGISNKDIPYKFLNNQNGTFKYWTIYVGLQPYA